MCDAQPTTLLINEQNLPELSKNLIQDDGTVSACRRIKQLIVRLDQMYDWSKISVSL